MKKLFKKNNKKGFTLVELLVTITIFVLLTGVVLFKQGSFDDAILLNNMAYDMGLTLRQAQSFGLSTREAGASQFLIGSGYGLYINLTQSNKNFVLFADLDSDNRYTSPGGVTSCISNDAECIQKYTINRGNKIQKVCVENACTTSVAELSILFKRPKPDALIYYSTTNGGALSTSSMARIVVSSANGNATTSVIISNVGQIYVTK